MYSIDLNQPNTFKKKSKKINEKFQNFKDIVWSTYLGGTGNDYISSITLDNENNIIIAGNVESTDMPVNSNSYQKQNNGGNDFFIAKFSSDYQLIWSTYLGGSSNDYLINIGSDADNNIWICSEIDSKDFPITSNAIKQTHSGGTKDIVICEFGKTGKLLYSTYLGGKNYESASMIAFDSQRNVYFTGRSWSSDFPTTTDAFQINKLGYYDGILIKFNIDTYKYYATYIGIPNNKGEDNLYIEGLSIDNQDNIIMGGHTNSSILPMLNSKLGNTFKGIYDVFLMKFDKSLNQIWSNYFGGSGNDRLSKITYDENDNLYCIGFTTSNNLIMKNSYQSSKSNGEEAFVFKINSDGELQWSTYLGGSGTEGNSMTNDNIDRIWGDIKYYENKIGILFKTNSTDLPIIGNEYYSKNYLGGQYDVFSMIFDYDGNSVQSSYIGGSNLDMAYSSVFNKDYIFICGYTNSNNIKTTSNAFQKNIKSTLDGFIIKFLKKDTELQDTLAPVSTGEYEFCGLLRDITIIDDKIHDKGIKSVKVISNINCTVQSFFISIKKIMLRIKLVDTTKNCSYEINVIDSAGNVLKINGFLIPDISTKISFIPSDTLFIISKIEETTSCDSLTIINNNEDEYYLDDGIFVYNNIEFTISPNQFPLKIPPKDSVKLEICFSPKNGNDSIYYDSLFIKNICSSRKLILVSKPLPADTIAPVALSIDDSCNIVREIIVTDIQLNDRGIKDAAVVSNANCSVITQIINSKKTKFIVTLDDITKKGTYQIKVIDSSDNLLIIFGSLGPSNPYPLSFNPSDTLFIKPTLTGTINCDSIIITNVFNEEYIFNDVFIYNNNEFSISPNQIPIIIPALGSVKLEVCFSPKKWTSASFFDSLVFQDACFSKNIILASKVISDDKIPPMLQSENDSCGIFKEIIISDDKINDTGIKSAEVITKDNCVIKITNSNNKQIRFKISLINLKQKGTYLIKVIDSVDNESLINGEVLPSSSYSISLNPPDTLFIKPTLTGSINCSYLTIVNYNEFEYILNDLYIYRNVEFSTPLHQFPIIIPPMDSIKLEICFSPKSWTSSKYIDSLYINDACFTKKLKLESEALYTDFNGDSRCKIPLTLKFDTLVNKSIIIFPNPAQSSLQISISHNSDIPAKILIFNSIGEIVFKNIINSKSSQIDTYIDISNLNSGIYIVVTDDGNNYNYEKVIISR
jgi:hypothetical protein